jgi:hypothetical protein
MHMTLMDSAVTHTAAGSIHFETLD